ncbi:hypothetical protein [uncultured Dokdonia sp.]|uniref:hypothetical protein n=1 Tax=uncultured Dokdonia sp. TaxID=575653 RepID=UPI002612A54B|nr:hypothetical protein [uncultured Dokdonia sp.]
MKSTFLIILFFFSNFLFSQTLEELNKIKDSLNNKIREIEKKANKDIDQIQVHLDSIDTKIGFVNQKINSIESIVSKKGSVYMNPNKFSAEIAKTKYRDKIHIISYDATSAYYRVIYNDKIGYVPYKSVKQNKTLFEMRKYSKQYNNTYKSNFKKSSSKRYIRGPRGGCYYINSNGNKTYVSRSLCN